MKLIQSALIVAGLLFSTTALSQTNRVSGTVDLPAGIIVSQDELVFEVSTDPLSIILTDDGELETSTTVTIARFSRSANYSILLKDDASSEDPDAPDYEDFRLRFECISGCTSSLPLTTAGFWDTSKGVVDELQAELFQLASSPVDDDGVITVDIALERADMYSGTIRLPDGVAADGDEEIELVLTGAALSNKPVFSQMMSASKDQTAFPFLLGVPRLSNISGWNVQLKCETCPEGVLSDPQFPTTAAGNPLSFTDGESFLYRKFDSFINMELTFIDGDGELADKSASILGALSLLLLEG
ncbi:hypothetical protein [Arenicella xantha]|uniref:Uncharacterized protein n=1 Tax=Arenicella xantha TaxID=644221 RepID=A0A395JK16_9GAMM|nr:hypothetical protein [Arenicella xantha]RBP50869.1 hypothetical protein DFR28_102285 [Arenicella xantha]